MSPIHSGAINKHFCIMQGLRAYFRVRQGDKPGLETKADIFVFMRRSRCIFGVAWAAAGRVASWQIVSSATQIHEELQPLVFLFCFLRRDVFMADGNSASGAWHDHSGRAVAAAGSAEGRGLETVDVRREWLTCSISLTSALASSPSVSTLKKSLFIRTLA